MKGRDFKILRSIFYLVKKKHFQFHETKLKGSDLTYEHPIGQTSSVVIICLLLENFLIFSFVGLGYGEPVSTLRRVVLQFGSSRRWEGVILRTLTVNRRSKCTRGYLIHGRSHSLTFFMTGPFICQIQVQSQVRQDSTKWTSVNKVERFEFEGGSISPHCQERDTPTVA